MTTQRDPADRQPPVGHHPARVPGVAGEKEEEKGAWKVTLLLTVGPFVFLALLVLYFVLFTDVQFH